MRIEIHVYPDSFPIEPENWRSSMMHLMLRIESHILDATVNFKSAAIGNQTFLDDAGMIEATVDIKMI